MVVILIPQKLTYAINRSFLFPWRTRGLLKRVPSHVVSLGAGRGKDRVEQSGRDEGKSGDLQPLISGKEQPPKLIITPFPNQVRPRSLCIFPEENSYRFQTCNGESWGDTWDSGFYHFSEAMSWRSKTQQRALDQRLNSRYIFTYSPAVGLSSYSLYKCLLSLINWRDHQKQKPCFDGA